MAVVIFIISLAILILVHEFGHFIVAKKCGMLVEEFGLGFPPKIWGKKIGETEYTLNAIPFGGFVKIFGENDHPEEVLTAAPDRSVFTSRSFAFQSAWKQAAVLVAGVVMNFLFAWLLISAGYGIGLPTPVGDIQSGQHIQNVHVVIINTLPKSPAAEAGLYPGDRIISIADATHRLDSSNITAESVPRFVQNSTGSITIAYERGHDEQKVVVLVPNNSLLPGKKIIGIGVDMIGTLKLPLIAAMVEGWKTTIALLKTTVIGLGTFFWDIIRLHPDFSSVSGPVGIAGTVSHAQTLGFIYLLSLVAVISLNLAVINLVPFPALDGGRLLFLLIEVVRGKKLSAETVARANSYGFIILIGLMLLVTVHDIIRLF